MATETIVAVFDTAAHADSAIRELEASGVPSNAIQHYAKDTPGLRTAAAAGSVAGEPQERGGFWSWLLGEEGPRVREGSFYEHTVEGGGTVVTVITDTERADTVMATLERFSPVNIEERASQYEAAGSTTPATATGAATATRTTAADVGTAGGEPVLQLAEEQLDIGKRAVSRGTASIRRYVVERPVEEQIRLRDERVSIERRPVSGAAPAADAFTERTIEMTESGEEAVVGKTARVYEEVGLRKDVSERTETVHDTVRRDEVEVVDPAQRTTAATVPGAARPVRP